MDTIHTIAVGCLIIIAISHFVRSYRKRLSVNVRRENRREEIEIRQESVEQLYIGINDEIDDSLVGLNNSGPKVSPQIRNTRAIINDIRTKKTNSDLEDNSSYLDPYFAENETEIQNSLKESSSSLSSSVDLVVLDHTEYLNPYQPLLEREQHISDGYEVAIPFNQNSERSSGFMSSEDGSSAYTYAHVYQQLHQDQSTNTHIYEKATLIVKEINRSEENEKERCGNKVSADKYDINSSDLLYIKETDENINDHVLFCLSNNSGRSKCRFIYKCRRQRQQ
ncbi:unnamed protein product [Mytilus coruscus]|uniref:Uncharacterized protein n=1 Tax=Mytilus coruscus TaxID=42192 RepID=A0A6J8DR84_MYTCO|nr:unnamed protein product [Mytilus coruscus]